MTWRFDASSLQFDQVVGHHADIDESNVGIHLINSGTLTMSWNTNEVNNYAPDEVLFELVFRSLDNDRLSRHLRMSSAVTQAEAYVFEGSDYREYRIGLGCSEEFEPHTAGNQQGQGQCKTTQRSDDGAVTVLKARTDQRGETSLAKAKKTLVHYTGFFTP